MLLGTQALFRLPADILPRAPYHPVVPIGCKEVYVPSGNDDTYRLPRGSWRSESIMPALVYPSTHVHADDPAADMELTGQGVAADELKGHMKLTGHRIGAGLAAGQNDPRGHWYALPS